jgi:hypothetical protein
MIGPFIAVLTSKAFDMKTLCRACCLLILLASASPGSAQTPRASVRGTIADPSGARIPAAEVQATRVGTNETWHVNADQTGQFAIAELPVGDYRIRSDAPGFKASTVEATLAVGQDRVLEVTLELANVIGPTEVTVTAPFVPIERDSPALSTLIDQRQVSGLPLDGRNFLELALLAPGTAQAPQGSAASVRGDFAFSVNGAREDFNNYLLDGVYNVDPKLATPGVRPSVDAIREFEVATSNYDASFGRNGAGQVNVITRSGTNRIEGTAYEFFRNGALDSRNFFAPDDDPAPDYSRHQFGVSMGGPIAVDRTFFFADYEGTRLREGITRVTNVPTLAERNGDFSQSLFTKPSDPFSRQPFPNGRIPGFFLSPIGAAVAALYPLPNRNVPFANYVASPVLRDDIDQFDARVDHGFGGGSRLTGRYSFSDRRLLEPFAGAGFSTVPGFGNDVSRRGQNLALTFTHSPLSTIVNDVRFGYNRVSIGVFAENTALNNQGVGLPALTTNARDAGLSLVSVAGFSPLGHEYNNPQASTSDTFQLSDSATWARGAHLAKAGVDWYGVRQSAFRDVQARGFLTFVDQGYTGNALADLLLGLPVLTGGARLDNPQQLRSQAFGFFAHDDWRATTSLTISAGLRYDYMSPPVDADDRANLYDQATGQLVAVGTNGMPRGGYEADRNNFAPRAGFAWAMDGARSVVRGGYGIYYNQGALATSEGLYFNPPYFNLSVFFPFSGLPPLTLADPFPAFFPIPIPQSATAYQRDLQTPWMEHWNIGLQRQLGGSRAVEISYVGSRGHDLVSARDLNQKTPSSNRFSLRPNPQFADITFIESRGSSRYNALQLKFQQRTTRGLSLLAAYTLGKSTDDASGFFTSAGDPNFPQDSANPGAERGRSSFDVRHRLSVSFSCALPSPPGNVWLEGWELQGIVTLQSGRPFTVALRPDIDQSNTDRSNLGFGYNDRPNVSGDPSLSDPNSDAWFNTAAFSLPPFGTFGNAERNILDGPGYQNVNLGIVKSLPVGSRARLQLRAEAFNLFNRVNFDLPDAFFGSPTFGRILSAQSPRRVQFGVKALF